MITKETFLGCRFVSTIVELVAARGVVLEVGSDFSAFEKALKAQPERNVLAPKFDPQTNDLGEGSAFWILGRDPYGEVVHTQAVQVIDLEGSTLASYLEKRFCDFVPAGHRIDAGKSRYCPAPGSRAIAGRVCYHGELWLKGGPAGYRGAGMTAVLARLAMVLSLMRWSPDYVFGFMFPLAACRGLAAREGYMHTEPGSIYWAVPQQAETLEEWAVWMSREDIRHIMQIPPDNLFAQLEESRMQARSDKAA